MGENPFRSVTKCNAKLIGALDHIRILQRTGGGDHRLDSGGGGDFQSIREGEESVAGHHRAFQRGVACIFLAELFDRLLDGADAVLLPGPDGKRLAEVSLSGRTDSYKNRMNFIILTLERN